jgi:hypothetical protein
MEKMRMILQKIVARVERSLRKFGGSIAALLRALAQPPAPPIKRRPF